jgi:hypothetical protein
MQYAYFFNLFVVIFMMRTPVDYLPESIFFNIAFIVFLWLNMSVVIIGFIINLTSEIKEALK